MLETIANTVRNLLARCSEDEIVLVGSHHYSALMNSEHYELVQGGKVLGWGNLATPELAKNGLAWKNGRWVQRGFK